MKIYKRYIIIYIYRLFLSIIPCVITFCESDVSSNINNNIIISTGYYKYAELKLSPVCVYDKISETEIESLKKDPEIKGGIFKAYLNEKGYVVKVALVNIKTGSNYWLAEYEYSKDDKKVKEIWTQDGIESTRLYSNGEMTNIFKRKL